MKNGQTIYTMDGVDNGVPRTVGDQLTIRHGYTNGNLLQASCAVIASLCTDLRSHRLSVPTAVGILDIYRDQVTYAINNAPGIPGIRSAGVVGTLAFCMKADEKVLEFYDKLMSGEGIFKTGKTSPILALRNQIQTKFVGAYGTQRNKAMLATMNATKAFVDGSEVRRLHINNKGLAYWVNQQKSNVSKVAELLTL